MISSEATLFRVWLMQTLHKDLEEAQNDNSVAGDRRDYDGATEAWARIEYIKRLIEKTCNFKIII